MAGTTAGVYILNTEKIAQNTNAQLASGSACHQRSTNAWLDGKVGTVVDVKKLPEVANDCVHPVLNSDPGVLAMLKSARSDADKLARYTRLETRSRFAFTPPLVAMVGALAQSDSIVENCLAQPKPPGSTIRTMMHAHNPTVLENLVFVGWLGQTSTTD